jgi:hypothetical protein
VIAIEESLKGARRELEEAEMKRRAALQVLEEVEQASGAESVVEADKGLMGSTAAALDARNIAGADAEALPRSCRCTNMQKPGAAVPWPRPAPRW